MRWKRNVGTVVFTILLALNTLDMSQAQEMGTVENRDLYKVLHHFHGHTCAGSLMGARMGLAAKRALEQTGEIYNLKAQYFHHSCPVDGIQVMIGTTYGNRSMEVVDMKEHRLLLTDRLSGNQAEVRLTEQALRLAQASRKMVREAARLPVDSSERNKLEREVESIYEWLRTAPESDVVSITLQNQFAAEN